MARWLDEIVQSLGVIVNISSMNSFHPLTPIPAYSAPKAGVSNFTQRLAVHMAQEYSPEIRVNVIADPASTNVDYWKDRQDDGILYVSKAGEILYRLRR